MTVLVGKSKLYDNDNRKIYSSQIEIIYMVYVLRVKLTQLLSNHKKAIIFIFLFN